MGQWPLRCPVCASTLPQLVNAPGALHAHAWVECGGQIIGQPERVTERYARLVSANVEA
ncbi:MAG: hypothetical protein FJ009_20970 [Chloroflexi bacterium]|nr:hypothetical protein [Chloroflexota bacterium]